MSTASIETPKPPKSTPSSQHARLSVEVPQAIESGVEGISHYESRSAYDRQRAPARPRGWGLFLWT
jgi:hypothetical protein